MNTSFVEAAMKTTDEAEPTVDTPDESEPTVDTPDESEPTVDTPDSEQTAFESTDSPAAAPLREKSVTQLQPVDDIHSKVKKMFFLLTALSVVILATMGARLVSLERIGFLDVGWMVFFAFATLVLTVAEIGCLRYIRTHFRPQMETLVLRDELTGIFNRRYMNDRIDEEISRCRRHSRFFSLIYFDLDGFKQVNDRYGHDAGDAILIEAAKFLAEALRREDILSRMGGDEFLAMLPDTSPSEAANLVIRLHTKFTNHIFKTPEGTEIDFLSFSAGVAFFPEEGEIRESLLAVADKNMYAHKESK